MIVEKFVHSCLRLTLGGEKLLIDPGKFSFVDGRVKPTILNDVSGVVITHDHPDHLDVDALKIILRGRHARVFGTAALAAKLDSVDIYVEVLDQPMARCGPFTIRSIPVKHEAILANNLPSAVAVLINDRLLHCGDSFDDALLQFAGVEVLALPVMAPFLTELRVMDFALKMAPKRVVPLHDGHVRDWFVTQRYDTYATYFKQAGIDFVRLEEPGARFEF
jgi:L-ascorbate metabolism protein UlaG (beta-lactamase superfamily)